ncbi:hypothetical protein F0Q45_20400 [Mycobacterium simiae]|uniref:Uncharacterized protein n=1 Tax=Mycobacterium simiae TaxID=1784 RepID=A0A5B1BKS5_MYCSI|nr:hypothetical protein F0Q45_20400 [Mycobacterium simiae]
MTILDPHTGGIVAKVPIAPGLEMPRAQLSIRAAGSQRQWFWLQPRTARRDDGGQGGALDCADVAGAPLTVISIAMGETR